jgi:anti-sigma regulatory factor (Ser/Thr protein kinase)
MGVRGVEPAMSHFPARDVDLLIDVAIVGRDGAGGGCGPYRSPGMERWLDEVSEDMNALAEARASLAADPRSVSTARRLLAEILDATGVRGEPRSHALLVTSELVTNAISHGSRAGDEIAVEFAVQPRRVRICVRDPIRGGSALVALTPDERRPAGRGLQIVEQLAAWSERVVDGRREVRAELLL